MKYRIKDYSAIQKRVEAMSTDELLLSVICPDYALHKEKPQGFEVTAFIHPTTEESAKEEIVAVNRDREAHTLITSDFENGPGNMISGAVRFPALMALSKCGDESLAYEMGLQTGKKARSVGYQWTFSPCVDILGNRRSPIVSIRTTGEDAETVLRYSGAYMKGLMDGGLYVTLKHFPGDGYSDHDQHLCTTENPLSREEWDKSFGMVYRTLINEGAQAIMPGHIALPAYDELDESTGLYPPASISKNLLTGLLREQLGFEGIIVSDATNMSGFCGYTNLYRASALFLEAGGDCLLFMKGTEEYLAGMKKQLANGTLTMETLKDRAYRMMCFTESYFENEIPAEGDDKALAACCEQITRRSVELLRDKVHLLPMKLGTGSRVAHFILNNDWIKGNAVTDQLDEELRARGVTVDSFTDPGPSLALRTARDGGYDLILCSILNEVSFGVSTVKLSGKIARNLMNGWMRYDTPAVFVSYGDPYFAYDYECLTDTVINTYGTGDFTASAVAELICGKK